MCCCCVLLFCWVVLYHFEKKIIVGEVDLSKQKSPFFIGKIPVCFSFHNVCLFSEKLVRPQYGVCCCYGFSLRRFTCLVSSSRLMQKIIESSMISIMFLRLWQTIVNIFQDFAQTPASEQFFFNSKIGHFHMARASSRLTVQWVSKKTVS